MAAFKTAFAQARKAGKKTFDWNGKSYNTKLAASPQKAPTPVSRQGSDAGSGGRATRSSQVATLSGASRSTVGKKDTLNRSAINKTNATTRETIRKTNERNKKK